MPNDINITNVMEMAEKNRESSVEEDYIVSTIGEFGVWQAIVTIMISVTRLIPVWNIHAILFLTPPTEFSCVRFKENSTVMEAKMSTCYDNCEKYKYYSEVFEESLISQFGLICEDSWLASFTQSVFMFGLLVGVFAFGWYSDRFGRSNAINMSGFISVVLMFIVPFSTNYWMFTILRFFLGLTNGGILASTSVMTLENIGPKYRYEVGCLGLIIDGVAEAALPVFAYYTTSWSWYLLSYTVVSVPILAIILFVPESPRWLMANGHSEKTVVLLTKAAKLNKLQVEGIKETIFKISDKIRTVETSQNKMTYLDLFATKELALMTTSSVIIWFIVGFTFFGLNQYISMIGTNIYVVVVIMGVIMIMSCPVAVFMSQWCGRKLSTIISLATVCITMSTLIFTPAGTLTSTSLGIVAISAGSVGFVVIYIYVTELYPTTMRNMGFSISSSGSKLGAVVAPFVANLRPQWKAEVCFAVLPVVAIVFCFLLPETKGKQLKDTLE